MWKADGLFTAIRFGWNLDQLVMRFDPDEASTTRQGLDVDITLQGPQFTFRLTFPLAAPGPEAFLLSRRIAGGCLDRDRTPTGSINAHDHSGIGRPLERAVPGTRAHASRCRSSCENTASKWLAIRAIGPAVLTVPGLNLRPDCGECDHEAREWWMRMFRCFMVMRSA